MKARPLPLLLAAAAGALMALQGTLNSLLGKTIGLPRATFLVQLTGAAAASSLLLLPHQSGGFLAQLSKVPWYAFLGGPIGVAIVFLVAKSIGKTGAGLATTSIIVAQLFTAYLIDRFGILGVARLPFGPVKIVGIILISAGGWLLLK